MPDSVTVQELVRALSKVTDKLRKDKVQSITFCSNGSGHLIFKYGCRQFSDLKEAAFLITCKGLDDHAPVTDAQRRLLRKHGTPKQFAEAVFNALGEVSLAEARTAVEAYCKEWSEAGTEK